MSSRLKHFRSVKDLVKKFTSSVVAIALAVSMAAGLAGCSIPTDENPPEQQGFSFKPGEKAQCLSNILPTLEGFVRGDASPGEVEQVWDCFRVALNIFSNYVRGRDDNRYSSRELANFFERYFLKNVRISDRLLAEFMRIKQIFVGGENESLTRDELFKLIAFSQDMKAISLRLLPYMKVYSLHWKVSSLRTLETDVHYFEDANLVIQEVAKSLSALIAKNDKSYTIANFVVLLDEISKLYGEDWPIVAEMQKVMPLVHKLKKTLAGGDETVIAANEWRRFALLGARGYIQYLRYHYFISTNDELGGGPELVYLARAFDDLFSYLGDMVAEKPQDRFTRAELLEVFEALGQFFPSLKVSDPFLLEVMKLKRLVFGGSLDNFTPQDFQRARGKVDVFRNLTEKVLVYSNLYGLSWQPFLSSYGEAARFFKAGDSNLVEIGKGLGRLIEDNYDLNDLLRLATEFEKLYPANSSDFAMVATVKRYLPILISTRQIVFSDSQAIVLKDQWSPFLITAAQVYNRYMQYYYFLKPSEISIYTGNGLSSLSSFVADCLGVIDTLISRKPGAVISFAEMEKLTVAAHAADLLPKQMQLKTLNDILQVVFLKVLVRPEVRLAGWHPSGLTTEATLVLGEEFGLWRDNQKFSEKFYKGYQSGQAVDGEKILAELAVQPPSVGYAELSAIYKSPQSRSFDGLGRLNIWEEASPYTLSGTDMVNLSRAVSRVVIRAYAQDLDRIRKYSGVSLVEAKQLFADVRPLAVSLGLLDETNTTFADSRFREASLFTPRADGDSYVSFVEFSDLVLDIFSGLKLDSFVREKLTGATTGKCPLIAGRGPGKEKVSIRCFTDVYAREMSSIFASMPSMKTYMLKMPRCELLTSKPWIADETLLGSASSSDMAGESSSDLQRYVANCGDSLDMMVLNMLKASGYITEKQGLVSLDQTSLVPHVMQYIETVIQRYDRARSTGREGGQKFKNGILDQQEAMNSYPVFKRTLVDVSGYSDDKTLRGLLAWIMENGKPPSGTWEKFNFLSYINFPERWDIHADRARLASILGFIADAVAQKAAAPKKSGATSIDFANEASGQTTHQVTQ